MFLSRILCPDGRVALALRQGSEAAFVQGAPDLAELVSRAAAEQALLGDLLLRCGLGAPVDVAELLGRGRLLPPLPDLRPALWPVAAADERLPLILVPPGGGLGLSGGGGLEGAAAALLVAGHGGVPVVMGWVQTHLGIGTGSDGARRLSCGPELCLDPALDPATGQARLMRADAILAEFGIPETISQGQSGHPVVADGAMVLHRRSRWLLRPGAAQLDAVAESRIAGLGLPLRNPLGQGGAVTDRVSAARRQA